MEVKPWMAVVVIILAVVIVGAVWMDVTRKPGMPSSPSDIPDLESMQGQMKGARGGKMP
ncbi:MAG: hypothetical protein IT210_04375 [Armatimonadetes bacterium]|nr:hypothetical protein [Armatimonadota bacterium]